MKEVRGDERPVHVEIAGRHGVFLCVQNFRQGLAPAEGMRGMWVFVREGADVNEDNASRPASGCAHRD
jgi:hypothetical protein